jgi:hypothetical protein
MPITSTRSRLLSGLLLLVALVIVLPIQHYLVNYPAAVDVSKGFAPAQARMNQEELLIEGAIAESDNILMLTDGQIDELIDLRFEKGRLAEATLANFANKPTPPPADAQVINFIWADVRGEIERQSPEERKSFAENIARIRKATPGNENSACRTLLKIEPIPGSKFPTKQRFYQTNAADSVREFDLSADTDLLVSIKVSPLVEEKIPYYPFARGCGKRLQVGDTWQAFNAGYWDVSVIAAANSTVHVSFIQDKKDSVWKDSKDFFQPFAFGSNPLHAQRVTVQSSPAKSTLSPRLEVTAVKGQPLAISRFSLNDEETQLDFSGTACIKQKGEQVTKNLLGPITKYPLFYYAEGAAVIAIFGWFAASFKNTFKRRPEEYVKPDDD